MALAGMQAELTNWTKSTRSSCYVYRAKDINDITHAQEYAREQRLSVIPHGAGHSYTDAALNTGGVVIDLTPMHRILSWDPVQGIMRVEPGVTMQELIMASWKDGWWPPVTPSTPDVTLGGCAAMNINGRNAWKCGPFGAYVLALDVLLPSGEMLTLSPERDDQLFHAFIGGLGLLGMITSLTLQLQRISSGCVTAHRRSAPSLGELLAMFAEEAPGSDYLEAWIDGFATGRQLGRGHITSAKLGVAAGDGCPPSPLPKLAIPTRVEMPIVSLFAGVTRPALLPMVHVVNRLNYGWHNRRQTPVGAARLLYPYTFWPPAAFTWYQATFPEGVETFQAFVPGPDAKELFEQVLSYSQQQGHIPLWCVIKQHRGDPFLLSYQVDGFSLELNYQRTHQNAQGLSHMLQRMVAMVIESGGRFYLAKDRFQTGEQYRQSVGGDAVDAFLRLKQRYDPELLLQSDLYRRLFEPYLR